MVDADAAPTDQVARGVQLGDGAREAAARDRRESVDRGRAGEVGGGDAASGAAKRVKDAISLRRAGRERRRAAGAGGRRRVVVG
jgi:hypothetical protein